MSKRASRANGESYYAVEFEVVSDGKYARPIADFRQQHYSSALFRLLSGPTENGNGHDNGHGHEANGHAESASQSKKLSKNSSLIFQKKFLRSRLKSGLIGLKPDESQNHCHINQ